MSGKSDESLEKLVYFRREIDRIFNDFFSPQRKESLTGSGHVDVSVDVFETPKEIIIEAELAGMSADNIELSVLRDVIIIEGNRPQDKPGSQVNFHCMERSYGKFRRIVEIPRAGDTANIQGEYDRGVLRVRLPRIEDRRGQKRRVPIE